MKHAQAMREIGKFLSGLIAGDLLFGLWLIFSGGLPQSFLGMYITVPSAWLWVGFDILVLFFLMYYSWRPKTPESRV